MAILGETPEQTAQRRDQEVKRFNEAQRTGEYIDEHTSILSNEESILAAMFNTGGGSHLPKVNMCKVFNLKTIEKLEKRFQQNICEICQSDCKQCNN